jgi:sugar transferase (PEP-CTERM/EpsH1 system associated)
MKVLFIVPYVPDLVRVRPYQLIRGLLTHGHQVTVASLWTSPDEQRSLANLTRLGAKVISSGISRTHSLLNCLMAVPSSVPFQSVYSWNPDLMRQIRAALQSNAFDIVHVEHIRGVKYALEIERSFPGTPVVWDSVDNISYLFEQAVRDEKNLLKKILRQVELSRTRKYETFLCGHFKTIFVTSPIDKQKFVAMAAPAGEIHVIAQGTDLDYFFPSSSQERDSLALVVTGKMSYHANVAMVRHLVEDIFPLVRAKKPGVKLWIVGKDPAQPILAFAQIPGVTVTGTVPDIRPYLQTAAIAVVPLTYGAGIQNKILEAMSCATAVVTVPHAVQALSVRSGQDLVVAEGSAAFADAVVRLLDDPQGRESLGMAGRRYVESHNHWSTITGQLEKVYLSRIHPT